MARAIVIDDEKLARINLKERLSKFFPELTIVAEAHDYDSGLKALNKFEIDLLFLDIKMPGKSGFDLLSSLSKINFEIIFVTAYDKFAIKAFDFCAAAYLLKPLVNEKLVSSVTAAINRSLEKKEREIYRNLIYNLKTTNEQDQLVTISSLDGFQFIKLSDIIYCEADGRYTTLYLINGEKCVSSQNLAHYYKLFIDQHFFQVHRSYVVNLKHIQKINHDGFLELSKKYQVPISRRKKPDLITRLGLG